VPNPPPLTPVEAFIALLEALCAALGDRFVLRPLVGQLHTLIEYLQTRTQAEPEAPAPEPAVPAAPEIRQPAPAAKHRAGPRKARAHRAAPRKSPAPHPRQGPRARSPIPAPKGPGSQADRHQAGPAARAGSSSKIA
jgi:hypothetical protein